MRNSSAVFAFLLILLFSITMITLCGDGDHEDDNNDETQNDDTVTIDISPSIE